MSVLSGSNICSQIYELQAFHSGVAHKFISCSVCWCKHRGLVSFDDFILAMCWFETLGSSYPLMLCHTPEHNLLSLSCLLCQNVSLLIFGIKLKSMNYAVYALFVLVMYCVVMSYEACDR
jgi:hypothetical protein